MFSLYVRLQNICLKSPTLPLLFPLIPGAMYGEGFLASCFNARVSSAGSSVIFSALSWQAGMSTNGRNNVEVRAFVFCASASHTFPHYAP